MRWLLLLPLAEAALVFDPTIERVIINVGSNTQPSLSRDPVTVAIAVEPMVGCRIKEQRNLHVLHAAVSSNNTLAFMQWYNKFGESSSLGTATETAEYTTRYRGKRKIVNVISLTTLIESIPLFVKLWYLKTDMQGFDFDALRGASNILRTGRAQYVMSEVWWDRYSSYAGQQNDFCLHQYPLMKSLGYQLVEVENGYMSDKYHGVERLRTLDTKVIRSHEEIMKMCAMQSDAPEKHGKCNEGDAYWKHASATLPPPRWREQSENPKRRRLISRLDGSV